MPATILHISDLHRDAGSAITSTTLLESLRLDRERYMVGNQLLAPDIAVVSGDIVLGVAADGPDADARLVRLAADNYLERLVQCLTLERT